jgi:RNA polymerase sigma-70 factor (ECF subfamily)
MSGPAVASGDGAQPSEGTGRTVGPGVVTGGGGTASDRATNDRATNDPPVHPTDRPLTTAWLGVDALAEAAKGGDREAVGELYRRIVSRARRTAAARCDPPDVDDAVSDGFIRALASFEQLRDPAAVERWIMRCISRAAIDLSRRRARLRPCGAAPDLDLERVASSPSAADGALAAIDRLLVRRAVAELPERHRHLLRLRFHDGLSVREIAARSGTPEGTLRRRSMEAARLLEQTLLRSLLTPASGPCAPITELLCRGARRELPVRSTRKVAAHLRRCPGCAARRDELGELLAGLRPSRGAGANRTQVNR